LRVAKLVQYFELKPKVVPVDMIFMIGAHSNAATESQT